MKPILVPLITLFFILLAIVYLQTNYPTVELQLNDWTCTKTTVIKEGNATKAVCSEYTRNKESK